MSAVSRAAIALCFLVLAMACEHSDRDIVALPTGPDEQALDAAILQQIVPAPSPATPEPTGLLELGDTRVRYRDGMIMVHVPAGQFEMGSSDAWMQPYNPVSGSMAKARTAGKNCACTSGRCTWYH